MNQNSNYIGIGRNPDGPDLPLGFGMKLAQEPEAMDSYGKLSNGQKSALIRHIQSGATGDDAKNLIAEAVSRLKNGQVTF